MIELDVVTIGAEHISDATWQEIVDLNERAARGRYPQTIVANPYVQQTLGLDGWESYAERQRNPQSQVGVYLKAGQLIQDPLVTLARPKSTDNPGKLLVVAITANNTSGHAMHTKMHLPDFRWAVMRWVAATPDQHERGLTVSTARAASNAHNERQPWSAYVWPCNAARQLFMRLGLQPDHGDWVPSDVSSLPTDGPLPTERFTRT